MWSVNLFDRENHLYSHSLTREKHLKIYVDSQDAEKNLIPHSHRYCWKKMLKRKVNLSTFLNIIAMKSVLNQ